MNLVKLTYRELVLAAGWVEMGLGGRSQSPKANKISSKATLAITFKLIVKGN